LPIQYESTNHVDRQVMHSQLSIMSYVMSNVACYYVTIVMTSQCLFL